LDVQVTSNSNDTTKNIGPISADFHAFLHDSCHISRMKSNSDYFLLPCTADC